MSAQLSPIPWLDVLLIAALIGINGVLSMSELAIVSSREARLKALARAGSRGAQCALDLASDPGETRDLSRERPEDLRALRQILLGWVLRVEGNGAKKSVDAAKAAAQQLKSLGYLE